MISFYIRNQNIAASRLVKAVADIPALTGIRGVAALAVVFCHLSPHLQGVFGLSDASRQFFGNGWVAVQLFFVLSGYIMAHNYPEGVAGSYANFLVKRLARIYPLHLLMLLVFVAAFFIYPRLYWERPCFASTYEFIRHIMLTQAWWGYRMGFWNTASWSISAELVAYLLFPWLTACSLRPRSHQQRFALVAGIMVAYMLLTFAFAQTNNKMPWKTAIPGVLACFTTGLILYRARGA